MVTPGALLTIRIDSLAYGGSGVGRVEGRVFFVPYAAPGDLLEVRVVEDRGSFARAGIVRIVEPGPSRRDPACRHFGECGGCAWQHVAYETQVAEKERALLESVRRIAGIEPPLRPVVRSPREYGYRSRTRLRVGPRGEIGYYAAGSHRLVDVEECPILDEALEARLGALRSSLRGKPAPDGKEIVLQREERGEVVDSWAAESRDPGFRQANEAVNRLLRARIREIVAERAPRGILDLYCGDGNVSLPLAREAGSVLGLDADSVAIGKARSSARALGLSNAVYRCSTVEAARSELSAASEAFDCLIADPPRRGLRELTAFVASLRVPLLVYVSCSPPALARDLRELVARGYRVESIEPFDMFPQSYHLEALAVLTSGS